MKKLFKLILRIICGKIFWMHKAYCIEDDINNNRLVECVICGKKTHARYDEPPYDHWKIIS